MTCCHSILHQYLGCLQREKHLFTCHHARRSLPTLRHPGSTLGTLIKTLHIIPGGKCMVWGNCLTLRKQSTCDVLHACHVKLLHDIMPLKHKCCPICSQNSYKNVYFLCLWPFIVKTNYQIVNVRVAFDSSANVLHSDPTLKIISKF